MLHILIVWYPFSLGAAQSSLLHTRVCLCVFEAGEGGGRRTWSLAEFTSFSLLALGRAFPFKQVRTNLGRLTLSEQLGSGPHCTSVSDRQDKVKTNEDSTI